MGAHSFSQFQNVGFIVNQVWWGQQNQERIAIKKIACDSKFPRKGGMLCHAVPLGEAPGLVRRQRERGKTQAKAFITDYTVIKWNGKAGLTSPDWLVWITLAGSEAYRLCLTVWYMALGWLEQGSSDPGVVLQWQRGQMSVNLQRCEKN